MVTHDVIRCLVIFSSVVLSQSFQCALLKGKASGHKLQMQPRTAGKEQSVNKRTPANKRQAIKWVVQGVERCLAEQQLPSPPSNSNIRFRKKNDERIYTYKRREDASLVDALYLLVNAKNQKEVLDAGKRIEVLMRVGSGRQDFPIEVTERVIKVTASTGLVSLSLELLRRLLHNNEFPSSIAYTAVINALRKNGRVSQMEDLLTELGNTCRRINNQKLKQGRDSTKDIQANVGVDIVAFNSFIASLCDAAVKDIPFTLSSTGTVSSEIESFNEKFFSYSNTTEVISPPEKYLYKALNLLRGDTSRRKFELLGDPDIFSYNSVLSATAKCLRLTASKDFSERIIDACLKGMEQRRIKADAFTYNARIEVALLSDSSEKDSEVIRLIDEAFSSVEIDRYLINLALVPLLRSGRRHELMSILWRFYESNSSNGKLVSSAFEAFLNTLVQQSELDFAREVFEVFFLSTRSKKQFTRIQMSRELHVVAAKKTGSSWPSKQTFDNSWKINPIEPTTRHFNILFGGYSKLFRGSRSTNRRKPESSHTSDSGRVDRSVAIAQNVYSLLNEMLKCGVPLDEFTVSSLMAFPASSDEISLLLERIEVELPKELSPVAYRSIIHAYGNALDPSSACWFFNEMHKACGRRGMGVDSWNVLLAALAHATVDESQINMPLNPLNSTASLRHRYMSVSDAECIESNEIISLVNGKTCVEASLMILDAMRNQTSFSWSSQTSTAPKPNSQTYQSVATAQSGFGTSNSNPDMAKQLFSLAKEDGVNCDGRFLNAVLRCYGDDIEAALEAWRGALASAAVSVGISSDENSAIKRSANLAASYNGLMHVCGRALRPDVALRLCYAMKKAGIEPNEISLNSYYGGKRVAMNKKSSEGRLGFKKQYESLLTVECTKYNTKDTRRANDKKIRIIL